MAALLFSLACSGEGPMRPTVTPCTVLHPGDARSVEVGQCEITRRSCADCHQESGSSDLFAGVLEPRLGTQTYPSNLSPDDDTGLGRWTTDDIALAIRSGLDANHQPLCFIMPRFDRMGDDEAYAIAHYLKSLPPVRRAIPDSICLPVRPAPDAGEADAGP